MFGGLHVTFSFFPVAFVIGVGVRFKRILKGAIPVEFILRRIRHHQGDFFGLSIAAISFQPVVEPPGITPFDQPVTIVQVVAAGFGNMSTNLHSIRMTR